MKKLLVVSSMVLVLFVGGCNTYKTVEDTGTSNLSPTDVNNIKAAFKEDVVETGKVAEEVGKTTQQIGTLIGKPVVAGIGTILTALSLLATGGFIEKERRERKDNKNKKSKKSKKGKK